MGFPSFQILAGAPKERVCRQVLNSPRRPSDLVDNNAVISIGKKLMPFFPSSFDSALAHTHGLPPAIRLEVGLLHSWRQNRRYDSYSRTRLFAQPLQKQTDKEYSGRNSGCMTRERWRHSARVCRQSHTEEQQGQRALLL